MSGGCDSDPLDRRYEPESESESEPESEPERLRRLISEAMGDEREARVRRQQLEDALLKWARGG